MCFSNIHKKKSSKQKKAHHQNHASVDFLVVTLHPSRIVCTDKMEIY